VISALTSPYDRDILDLAVPALAGLAAGPLISLVDTAFVGQLGRVSLAALGVNTSIFSMTFVIFNFLAYGTTPRVGRAVGDDDWDEAGRVVMRALTLAGAVGIVALIVLQVLARPILVLMGASEELMAPALAYLRIRALAGPAVLLITASHGAFRGYQDTRTPMIVTLGFNVINGGLDPILIFGFDWGLAGAAAATAVGQWVGALTFMFLLLKARREELGITVQWPGLRTLVPFLKVGRDLFLRTASLVGTMTLATAMAARVGVTAVAAHQVAAQLWMFLAVLVDALAVAAQALVSKHLGRDDPETARRVSNRLLQWGLLVGVGLGLGFWALRPVLPGFFTDDPGTAQMLLDVYLFVVVLQPLNGLVFVGDGIYMGAEEFSYLAKAMIGTAAAAAVVLVLSPTMGWGLTGVWWGITLLMGGRLLTLAGPYVREALFVPASE
jgi:MATE family multidrug resistance protein